MKIPGYDALKAFEAAHFTASELAWLAPEVRQLPKAGGMSPDDSTLTADDYEKPGDC